MIRLHCGTKLVQILPHNVGYLAGRHQWMCPKCGRVFTQRTRRPTSPSK